MEHIKQMGLRIDRDGPAVLEAIRRVLEVGGWTPEGDGASRLQVTVTDVPGSGVLVEVGDHEARGFARQLAQLTGRQVHLYRVSVGNPLEGGGFAWSCTSTGISPGGANEPGPRSGHHDLDDAFEGDPRETARTALWWSAVEAMPGEGQTLHWSHPAPDAPIHADPWAFAPRIGTRLEVAGESLSPEASSYLVWRLEDRIEHVSKPPDLGRWTGRLLRRHGLEQVPERHAPEAASFWADVMARTERERSRTSGEQIPAWKFEHEGEWVLTPEECDRAARKLGAVPSTHQPTSEQAALVARVRDLIDTGDSCTVVVHTVE